MRRFTTVTTKSDVTEEILTIAENIESGWFGDNTTIDWCDFIDRMDGIQLHDDTVLDMGESLNNPAILKIRAHIKALRKLV